MRVAVIGATGNAGTGVLRALADAPEVDSVLGVARRVPDGRGELHESCDWASIDIGAATPEQQAVAELAESFQGVDAVIHLAWLIQPNDDRELLRRVNVKGTARVLDAAARAGVGRVVVASSVGAYSPDDARSDRADGVAGATGVPLRDESWPVGGIESSHYSVDKAAQEDVLDRFERAHPEIVVTRLRPGLKFQADAASEIQRYFLGSDVPVQVLRHGRPPALPLPKGLCFQAVHSDDAGRAYALAAIKGVGGAFNICADDVVTGREVAEILGHGRTIELPVSAVRTALAAAHRTGAVAADVGWLDMAMEVPLMDNSRAKAELDWHPTVSARDALKELVEAMIEGKGGATVPLRPHDPAAKRVSAVGESTAHAADRAVAPGGPGENIDSGLLGLYLADHATGATAGQNRIERMAEDFADTPVFAQLSTLAADIGAERALLERVIRELDLEPRAYRRALSWAGERAGRLKFNRRIAARSPMTLVLEAEMMRAAVAAKLGGWETLRDNAEALGVDPHTFGKLREAADEQLALLDEVHAWARARAFREDLDTFNPNKDTEESAGNETGDEKGKTR
ncbi:NAD-dependent epimerase/dehydratase family protein [Corynebacterium xerosis]|uniref:NAD-dependent epimerase/dehydratase family protein n=1 Tax=Corynebacterium xerosis TaxID=1725 RepID=UPI003879C3B4